MQKSLWKILKIFKHEWENLGEPQRWYKIFILKIPTMWKIKCIRLRVVGLGQLWIWGRDEYWWWLNPWCGWDYPVREYKGRMEEILYWVLRNSKSIGYVEEDELLKRKGRSNQRVRRRSCPENSARLHQMLQRHN